MHVHWSVLALIGSPLIALSIGVALLARAAPLETLVRGPYLQRLTTDGVSIRWRTRAPAWCAVTVRAVAGGPTRVLGDAIATECAVDVDGLEPGTRYAYIPLADGAPLDDEAVFRTDDPDLPFTFLVLGDSGSGGAAQYAVRDRMLATPADFILHTGDMVYENGEAADFDRKLFRPYRALLRSMVLWPSIGNHDERGDDRTPWFDAFHTPANNADGDEGYYSFTVGNAHVIVLDSTRSLGAGSPQWLFLEQELAAATALWKFVAFHHTMYSTGSQHGGPLGDPGRQADLLPLLDPYGVDVVFMGHEHSYERTHPLHDNNVVAGGVGRVYVTTGGGGHSLHDLGEEPAAFTAYAESAFHFVRVTVDGPHLFGQMIRTDGSVRDTFTISKANLPPPPTCGDGVVNVTEGVEKEECDGDDRAACPGVCGTECRCEPVCGDQRVDAGEECDGADAIACPDLCLSDCTCGDQGDVLELPAIADTFVAAGEEADQDHGGLDHVEVDGDPASVAYLKFDLSSVTGYVVRATLSLYAINGSFDGGTVYPVPDASWIEGTANPAAPGPGLKWTAVDGNGDDLLRDDDATPYAPRLDRRAGAFVAPPASWAEADVTTAFQGAPGLYAIAIMSDANNRAMYASREHVDVALHPRLRLELGEPPVTTTITTTTVTSSTTTSTSTTSASTSSSSSTSTTSTLPPGEECRGGVDDDGDGFTDCADPDCTGDAACPLGCVPGPEWASLACRFTGLAEQVGNRLASRRVRTALVDALGRAASARSRAEASCALGEAGRARASLRRARRAVASFRRRLGSPAGRKAIAASDRAAWRALAAEMRADLDALRGALDCG